MRNKIELNNISHYFDTTHERINLFSGLNLTFEAGRSHAIVGPSGAGKSSLLSIAAGLDMPKEGEIHIRKDGRALTPTELRANTGFIFQHFHLMPELDSIGNLALPLRLKGDKDAYNVARIWLDRVGLKDRATHKPNQLSGGEQQRIAVARAFVTRPAFIFADEPTGNLDANTSSKVADLMFEFAEESSAAFVLVTHSNRLAARADVVFRLAEGNLLEQAA